MPATILLLSQTVTKNFLLHTYLIKKHESRTNTEARDTRIDGQTEYSITDTARCALGWHVMALHCSVLRARELFVLRMRTLAIQYPDPWCKSAIPNKENSPPCPGWGEVGFNIDRCISTKVKPTYITNLASLQDTFWYQWNHSASIKPLVLIRVRGVWGLLRATASDRPLVPRASHNPPLKEGCG